MNTQEAVRTAGLMAGLIIGNLFARYLGFGVFVQLIFAIVGGIAVGFLADRVHGGGKKK